MIRLINAYNAQRRGGVVKRTGYLANFLHTEGALPRKSQNCNILYMQVHRGN